MPSRYISRLSAIATEAIEQLTARNQAREQALAISREVIRLSANAIRAVHRAEFDEGQRLIDQAGIRLQDAEPMRSENPEIYYAGFSGGRPQGVQRSQHHPSGHLRGRDPPSRRSGG